MEDGEGHCRVVYQSLNLPDGCIQVDYEKQSLFAVVVWDMSFLISNSFLDHAFSTLGPSDPVTKAFQDVTDAEVALCKCEDAARVESESLFFSGVTDQD